MDSNVQSAEMPMWYAMSAPYRNELKAKSYLDAKGVENFLPLQYKIITNRYGRKVRKLAPAISNLIFARTTRSHLQEVKQGVRYLQYRTRPEAGRNVPIVVPDYQMQQFITVCKTHNNDLLFLEPSEIDLEKGTRVRIIGGPFDGVVGIFVKLKGVRHKRVVVQVAGVAVATAEVEPQYIEVLND